VKLLIALLSILAIALLTSAFVYYGPAFATQLQSCQHAATGPYATGCLTSGSRAATLGLVLYLGGVVAALLAWVLGLVKTAQIRRWLWFIVVFLLSPLGSLLYGLVGPTSRPYPVHR
jgi:uncharacterized membrane protein